MNKRVYVWRIYCEDNYMVYTMDVPGFDQEDALNRCQHVLTMDYPETVRITGRPSKFSTWKSYCAGVLWYLIPVMDKDNEDDSVII